MKLKYMLVLLVLIAGFTAGQAPYPLVTLYDINYIHPDSLVGFPPSPLANDTVRVRGMIMVRPTVSATGDRRPIIWAGARWASYIQDPNSGLWGGLNILQNDTVGSAQGTLMDLADTGKVYEFTGVVTPYFQSTELVLITSPEPIPISPVPPHPNLRPTPIPLTLDSFYTSGTGYNYNMRKYQGMYVIIKTDNNNPLITSDRVTGTGSSSGNFKLNNGRGHFAFVYAQSTYFKSNATGIVPGYQPPPDGSYLPFVRGILTMRADAYYIVPCYPGDIAPVSVSPPTVSNVKRNLAVVTPNTPVVVTATAKGLTGYVTAVKLFYHTNGGALDSISMTRSPSDSTFYSGTIPGVADSALVDFYVKATDNNGLSSTNPSNITTGRFFYLVLARPLTIQDVRYSPFGSGFSGYNGYRINLTGIVTADTTDIPGYTSTPLRLYMQNGQGPWSGINIGASGNQGNNILNFRRGDRVSIDGLITKVFDVTRIDSATAVSIISSGNPLPEPEVITTGLMGLGGYGQVDREKWSSVLVKFNNLSVDSTSADGTSNFGEILINDGSGRTRVELQDGNHKYHNGWDSSMIGNSNYVFVRKGDHFESMQGIMFYSFSNYKLVPRKDSDFAGYVADVKSEYVIPQAYELLQNYPNPFNPSTSISYSIPKSGLVTLKIYNILGQEVATLMNQVQSAGKYSVSFNASRLTSGVYFYSLTADNYTQVKKMLLIK